LRPQELLKITQDSGLDVIITIEHFADLARELGVKTVLLEQSGLKRRFLMSKLKSSPPVPVVEEQQTAVILYTSGTSGEAKGVELTYGNLSTNCRDSAAHTQISSDHVLLSVLPPFHVFGLTAMTLLPMWLGMTVHFIPRFNPIATVKTIQEKQISVFMAIPSMFAAMQRAKRATAESFKSLYLAMSGGEPLQASTAEAFQDRFGVQLNEGYGLTETSPVVSINLPWDRLAGAVGKPIPNCEVRIVGDSAKSLPPGEDGEIQVRSPGVMKGYYNRAAETAEVMDAEGWFKTGDQGQLSEDGFLSITGRIKEMLIIGGENVFPSEIENVLIQHPAVDEVAVIGIADESRGEVPLAFVILKEGQSAEEKELRSHCRDRLASLKVPRQVKICDDLPHGPTGKILKRALADLSESQISGDQS
ncbi:MAG: class I adenylate-forming enzyme family protein, partial [Planctomycetota bacterium]